MRFGLAASLTLMAALSAGAVERLAPSIPGVDAPELARLGSFAVGHAVLVFVDPAQADVLAFDPATGVAPKRDRRIEADVWYPAEAEAGQETETYHGSLPAEPPRPPAQFAIPGIAVRDAKPVLQPHPLVVVSHGYSNDTAVFSWLGENLASKGYVVAAIRHRDPPLTEREKIAEPLLRRPLDVAFVVRALQRSLGREGRIDPSRIALIGYSMGGYGVLTVAGAELDPHSPLARLIPGGLLAPYARGGESRDALRVPGLRAVVAISPAGGALGAWGTEGLRGLATPLFLISGDRDWTVDYRTGADAFFDRATNSNRYLLTFRSAGHRIAFGPAPGAMRERLWDFDWFEDPVWRQDRIIGINLHFITAFLDRYVRDDEDRATYLDALTRESAHGEWPASVSGPYDAYSTGEAGVTVWKGFQKQHAEGLELRHALPAN